MCQAFIAFVVVRQRLFGRFGRVKNGKKGRLFPSVAMETGNKQKINFGSPFKFIRFCGALFKNREIKAHSTKIEIS